MVRQHLAKPPTVDEINPITLRTLNYGNSGILLIMMGNAGHISSTVESRKACLGQRSCEDFKP